ncbi:Cytochrome P450 [Celeribacter indicus]|uniref:Cytochrome P450 n=2 Tax=Celeribacter indicus TaxID=1208324 RepID=A0A0B5DN59_9RHOB|nr:cytochrome P450 [Celeribacter indicus]SDX42095.1 Cytochrome P450 [Celeribacter indicus]
MDQQTTSNAIADPKTYGDPSKMYALFERLRREEPVRWCEPEGYRPFWAIARHAEIMEIERQPDLFISAPRTALRTFAQEENIRKMTGSYQMVRTLLQMDPPDHRKYRALSQAWFMPGKLRSLEPAMKRLAGEFIDRMESLDGNCDFAKDIASLYPLRAILQILGVPPEDEPMVLKLTQQFFAGTDPSTFDEDNEETDITSAAAQLFPYFNEKVAERRKEPKNDLFTLLADAEVDGQPISDFERNSYFFIVAVAGHDTTSLTMASFMHALVEHPDQLRRLQENPALLEDAINEAVRWASPVFHFMRTATADYEIGGKTIRKDDSIMLLYPSANRDESVFEAPEEFRIDRQPNRHVGFGYGPHLCLGQHFAKLELRMFFGQLLPRLREVSLDGEPQWLETNFVGGLKTLPISYRLNTPELV